MTACELNQIFLGEIAAVQNYGAFVRIPGSAQQGLIHKSQVSSSRVDDVGDVLQRGERVWCKIISINDDGKISLSMKFVNQGNGTDLDPNGVQLQRDEQRRRGGAASGQRKVIELQAVLNTTCAKCGTHGHLSNDCFMSPDGKTYELIPEIEEEKAGDTEVTKMPESANDTDAQKIKKHKSKKSKGKKKSKKSKSLEDSSGNDSDSEDKNRGKKSSKKKAKDKKRKKKDKKNRDNSSQSYSTDNDNEDKDSDGAKVSLKRKSSDHGSERRTKKCKYSSSKR